MTKKTDLALVRRHGCPQCENRDHLELVERAFLYRPLVCTDDNVTAGPREEGWFAQEVAITCRTCGWTHNLRDCTESIPAVLSGEARCNHG